jgi:FkbM family methyltransferase
MFRLTVLRRKLSTARQAMQAGGLPRLLALGRLSRDRWKAHLQSKKDKIVSLDGCTFNIKGISSISMRRAILDKRYESFERRAVMQYVRPDIPIVELGGCIGVVCCIANRLLIDRRSHVVVEANPQVIPLLKENRDLNHCDFEILNRAISYDQSEIMFAETDDYWGNALQFRSGVRLVTVSTTCLRDIVDERGFETFTLICDIEGHEYDLVRCERDVLQSVDTIVLETHPNIIGENKTIELLNTLIQSGFQEVAKESAVRVLKKLPGSVVL